MDTLIIKLEKKDLALYKAVSGKFMPHYYGKIREKTKAFEEAKKLPFLKKDVEFEPLKIDLGEHQEYLKAVAKHKGKGTSLDMGGRL